MEEPIKEVIVLLNSDDPAALADWATKHLNLDESWRAANENGAVEHVELRWGQSRISINATREGQHITGKTSLGLRVDDEAVVRSLYQQVLDKDAELRMELTESRVALSFTVADLDGNEWWVNAETGFLDRLREDT